MDADSRPPFTTGELALIAEALLTLQTVYNTDGRDAGRVGELRDKVLACIPADREDVRA